MITKRYILALIIGLIWLIPSCRENQEAAEQIEHDADRVAETSSPPTHTVSPAPTSTPTPTVTASPTLTPIPSPEVIAGPELPQFLLIPSGYLVVEDWFGIPIFPGVIKAQEAYDGYYYSADQPVSAIRTFYEDELLKTGWVLSAVGETENGHQLLIFKKDSQKTVITLYNFNTGSQDPNTEIQIPPSNVLIVVE